MARGPVGKYTCLKCTKEISLIAKTRHDRSCNGSYKIYKTSHNLKDCCFCGQQFETVSGCGNHIIQCDKNPARIYRKTNYSWNKGNNKESDPRILKSSETLKKNIGLNHGRCSDPKMEAERRKKISIGLKKNPNSGGYRENAGHSKKFKVMDSYGKETTLQSTYELECSEVLNKMNVKWNRPKAMKYGGRNYFADFYLPEFDIYLDPKNSYKAKLDAEKIASVIKENKVKLFVLLKEQITEEYLRSILDMQSSDKR